MFEELDIIVENFNRAIMETITYKGKTLAELEGGEVGEDETNHQAYKAGKVKRMALYRQNVENGEEIQYIQRGI
tara:strand:+ start:575 stop:796 length:222 start_codon:yes stop_codon:yes gene_type:complete